MNKPEALSAEQILERVRGSMVPPRADAARNFAGIEARLGLSGSGALPAGQGLGSSAALVAARGLPLSAQLAVLVSFGLAAGMVGYGMGRSAVMERSAVERSAVERSAVDPPPGASAVALVQPAAALGAEQAVAPAATASGAAPAPVASPQAVARAQTPRASNIQSASLRRHPARPVAPAVLHRATSPAITKSNAFELSEALELLRRAEAAVRHSDGLEARMWLGDLERRAPREMLREERLATGVLAACALGDVAAARAALLELEQSNPESLYRARLEGSCATGAPAP
jgi:hypothetical protein